MIVGLYPLYLFDLCLCAPHLVGVMFIIKDLFRSADSFSMAVFVSAAFIMHADT